MLARPETSQTGFRPHFAPKRLLSGFAANESADSSDLLGKVESSCSVPAISATWSLTHGVPNWTLVQVPACYERPVSLTLG